MTDVRLVELLGALSLATDLGTGQPQFHGVRTSVLAVALAREVGLSAVALAEVQQVALLRFLGCTSDSADTARMAGGDDRAFLAAMAPVAMGGRRDMGRGLVAAVGARQPPLRRVGLVAAALGDPGGARRSLSAHCEVAAMLAERLEVGAVVRDALAHAHERWDGRGFPAGLPAEAVPTAVRVAVVARDADLWWRAGPEVMADLLRARRGRAYDPTVVDACLSVGAGVLANLDTTGAWEAMLAAAPPAADLVVGDLDRALSVVADFADLKSPWTRGHSARVADLVTGAAHELGLPPQEVTRVRGAALVHDLGRVGVSNDIWDRPAPLGAAEWQQVRQHPYLTEATLACCPGLADLGRLGGAHHERLDGSGYHRGSRDQGSAAQLLAVADLVAAMAADRPHRSAVAGPRIADDVRREMRSGRLDRLAADAVLAAAGQPGGGVQRGAGRARLSDREVEVLRQIARGRTNRQVAADLHLSVKTVGRHVENVYAKIGVRSRAAAAVFAMGHRLLDT